MHHREQVSRFKLEQSDRLDLTTQKIVDAIVTHQDIFHALHDTQITLIRALHGETVLNIQEEHAITRCEIIQEIRVRLLSGLFPYSLTVSSNSTFQSYLMLPRQLSTLPTTNITLYASKIPESTFSTKSGHGLMAITKGASSG
jgi:hypothetical protein